MNIDEEDDRVFAAYGRAMLAAQLLEFEVFRLANLEAKTPQQFEQAMSKLGRRLATPTSRLARDAGALPATLKQELLEVIEVRHQLAHSFLMEYRIKKALDEDAVAWAVELLDAAFAMFQDLEGRIEVITRGELEERGWGEDLSAEEEQAVRESLRRWSQSEGNADDGAR